MKVTVSICIQTYQHAEYIKKCLDSILSQKTNFYFEILLGEDCSTDGTREICIEYANKYSKQIKLFLHDREKNIHINGKPTGRYNLIHNLQQAKGKYIALCEGDDYWTDNNKLQKQVAFMEDNPDFSISFHAVDILNLRSNNIEEDFTMKEKDSVTSIIDLAEGNYIHTPSVLYRNSLPKVLPEFLNTIPVGDYPLHLLVAQHGKIKYFREKMAVYRLHDGGRWSNMNSSSRFENMITVLNTLINYFQSNQDVLNALNKQRCYVLSELYNHYKDNNDKESLNYILYQLTSTEPFMFLEYFYNLSSDHFFIKNKLLRILNHPVSGKVIKLLAMLKKDNGFGSIDVP